jgi:heme-degrading monooxygenase HmoA
MYARVWRIGLLPENIERFGSACRSVGVVNKKTAGYRGLLILRGGPLDSPEATVVSLWESLAALRASESDAFQKAVAGALACSKPGAALREEEILLWEIRPTKNKDQSTNKSKKQSKKKKGRIKRRSS